MKVILQNHSPQACLICERIDLIRKEENPFFVAETKTGFVVLGDFQFFRGYTLFLSKLHVRELHELDPETRKAFLWEMSEVAGAVGRAFKPVKLNYELLGNTDDHMHWHLFPRHHDDPYPRGTVWNVDRTIRNSEDARPDVQTLKSLKQALLQELEHSSDMVIVNGGSIRVD
jgi:diadenosine tetraphosphate (Ap4A) HIT family hydrolase